MKRLDELGIEDIVSVQGHEITDVEKVVLNKIRDDVALSVGFVRLLDKSLPDRVCTDEAGGKRTWWGRQQG